ncbi:MAG: hypothetical protein KIS92_22050 [Planctomycetota bacterium]|nr:hypothetical protein [Planctomycetota bacterium]
MRDDLASSKAASPRHLIRTAFLGLLALFVLYLLGSWIYVAFIEGPEDKIRKALAASAQGARDRNPAEVTRVLSEDFKGPGGIDKTMVHQAMMHLLITTYRRVDVALGPDPIPVTLDPNDAKKATAVFRVRVRGKITEESEWQEIRAPEAQGAQFHCTFKLTENGWKMDGLSITE